MTEMTDCFYEQHLPDEEATIAAAAQLASTVRSPCVIYLHGDLGAGKTTFVRGFLHARGVIGRIKSPTYTLVESYPLLHDEIAFHFDFYRINSVNELDNLGIDEYFKPTSICLIEWPENAGVYLPVPDIDCYLSYAGDARFLRVMARSEKGRLCIEFKN